MDLAGSERVSKTRSDGQVLREAGYINKSLHMLEQVSEGQHWQRHPPAAASVVMPSRVPVAQ